MLATGFARDVLVPSHFSISLCSCNYIMQKFRCLWGEMVTDTENARRGNLKSAEHKARICAAKQVGSLGAFITKRPAYPRRKEIEAEERGSSASSSAQDATQAAKEVATASQVQQSASEGPQTGVVSAKPTWDQIREAIGKVIKFPDDVKEAGKFNFVQGMAKKVKKRSSADLWDLVHASADRRAPSGSWPFKICQLDAPSLQEAKQRDMDFWTRAELRIAAGVAQNLRPVSHFYESLRLQHANYIDDHGTLAKVPTYQGDGQKPFRKILEAMATGELHTTKTIMHSSVGWILLFDGSNKARWSTKGELHIFRDCDQFGEIRIRVSEIIFVTNNDVKELRRLAVKPFGHEAMWGRVCDLMQQRFCEMDPLAQNFLPHMMVPVSTTPCTGMSAMFLWLTCCLGWMTATNWSVVRYMLSSWSLL